MQVPEIGFFESAFRNSSVKIPLLKALIAIREGVYAEIVEEARTFFLKDKSKYISIKTSLPAVTFSGIFGDARKLVQLEEYTNLIVLDIDNLESESLNKKKKALFEDAFTYAVWISPSGLGLKILVGIRGTKDTHKISFDLLVNHYQKKYGVRIDLSGCDITRLCFLSYDKNLQIKDKLIFNKIYAFSKRKNLKIKRDQAKTLHEVAGKRFSGEIPEQLLYEKRGRNKPGDREMILRIIGFLKERKLSVTDNYESWYRVALAIANTYTFDLGKDYFLELCRLDGIYHDEEKSIGMLEYCYRNRRIGEITLSSLIFFAVRKGFIVRDIG